MAFNLNPKSPYLKGTANEESTDFSPSLKTPGTVKVGGVPVNDDEAERRIRRRENHIRFAISPGCHTPRSIARNPERARTLESGTSTFSNAQISEHYAICVKLSAENKINAKNAFGLHLIDCMAEMLRKRGEMTNFQVAGCTLDASAKIYASRVDSIYNDAYKMLGGLGRSDKQDNEDNDLNQNPQQVLKKKTKKHGNTAHTIEKNLKSLDINTFDLEFEVDPLFKKTSAAFDEGGVQGLLLNQLSIDSDLCCLFLDPTWKHTLTDKAVPDCPVMSRSEIKSHFKYFKKFQSLHICKTFNDFLFNKANSNVSLTFDNNTDNTLATYPDNEENNTIDEFDSPETNDHLSEVCIDTEILQSTQHDTADANYMANDISLFDTIQVTEYSYFNPAVLSSWAGPHHWKLKPHNKESNKNDKRQGLQQKKKYIRQVFRVDLAAVPDQRLFTKGRAGTTMTSIVLKRMVSVHTLLPHALSINENALHQFFCRAKWKVRANKKVITETLDNISNSSIVDQNADINSYPFDDFDNEDDSRIGFDQMSSGQALNDDTVDTHIQNLDLMGSNLIYEPKKVAPIMINYAKQAKKIDVKNVKKTMWDFISSHQDSETRICFSSVHLTTKSQLSSSMSNELSIPISFVCLLHLANEKVKI